MPWRGYTRCLMAAKRETIVTLLGMNADGFMSDWSPVDEASIL